MDGGSKARVRFALANLGWTVLVTAVAAAVSATAFYTMDWASALPWVAMGAAAGAAVGSVRDSRLFQAALAATGIILLGFSLHWSRTGGVPEPAAPLLGAGLIALGTSAALVRIWGRERREDPPTVAEIDEVMAHPHTR